MDISSLNNNVVGLYALSTDEIFRLEQSRIEQSELLIELERLGVPCSTVWDLLQVKSLPQEVLECLLVHLSRDYSDGVREGIARSLIEPKSRKYYSVILEVVESLRGVESYKRTLNALFYLLDKVAKKENLPDISNIILDEAYGERRFILLSYVKRNRKSCDDVFLDKLRLDPLFKDKL